MTLVCASPRSTLMCCIQVCLQQHKPRSDPLYTIVSLQTNGMEPPNLPFQDLQSTLEYYITIGLLSRKNVVMKYNKVLFCGAL